MAKRRKVQAERKEAAIHLRLTETQKERLTAAATRMGLDVSNWIRSLALQKSDEILGAAE